MICRLCLKNKSDSINIFDAIGVELQVANILAKHFWFVPKEDELISTAICSGCWSKVSDFHQFYLTVEQAHAHQQLDDPFDIKTEEVELEEFIWEPLEHNVVKYVQSEKNAEDDSHEFNTDALLGYSDTIETSEDSILLTANRLQKHENDDDMTCGICAKVLCGKTAFSLHQLEHVEVDLPKLQCDLCGLWYKDKSALQRHKRRHSEAGISHICDICNRVAPNRLALSTHKQNVHAERIHKCRVCHKAFNKPSRLKEHMAMHTGEALYKCPHCPKMFNSNSNMHTHRRRMHSKNVEDTRRQLRVVGGQSQKEDTETAKSYAPTNPVANDSEVQMAKTLV